MGIDVAERLLHDMSLPCFKRLPLLLLSHVCIQLRGAWVFMPQHPLHTMEALAVLG